MVSIMISFSSQLASDYNFHNLFAIEVTTALYIVSLVTVLVIISSLNGLLVKYNIIKFTPCLHCVHNSTSSLD